MSNLGERSETAGIQKPPSDAIYVFPELYELAFSYRDYALECDRLESWYALASGRNTRPSSILELAAGPADHAIELARRGARSSTLDLSPSMCEHARSRSRKAGVSLDVHAGDMTEFSLNRTFDLAFLMLSSISHIHELDRVVAHMKSVARHLGPDGIYCVETTHPRDFLGRGPRTTGVAVPWTVESGGRKLTVRWGRPDDPYDLIKQVFDCRIELTLEERDSVRVFEDHFKMRDLTYNELTTAARSAGLELRASYGDFERNLPLDHEEAWRMILLFGPQR
ncbi:MAG: class I SAM-dependent methyltransferase [Deltaproteobacteria bacterium]|nr:class I SAM-dependent methyltransferase [Deltaproteobacteria bacterium]